MPYKIIIADDHDIIRTGIKNILYNHDEYKVIAEAVDGEDALKKVEEYKPDILLLDVSMPKIGGLDIITQVHHISPETKILIITVHKADAYIMKALKSGVQGYLQKENAAEDLLPALRKVTAGGLYLASTISSYLADKAMERTEEKSSKETFLTSREKEILRLVSEGKSAKEIAETVFISRRTVENYKNTLLKKLNLH
ncbi:MAG: response regulator transcription factor, partial [Candidatus Omnitrophota bacterium]